MKDAAKIDETLGVTPEQIEEENKPQTENKRNFDKEIIDTILRYNDDLSEKEIEWIYDLIITGSGEEERKLNLDEIYNLMKTQDMLKTK